MVAALGCWGQPGDEDFRESTGPKNVLTEVFEFRYILDVKPDEKFNSLRQHQSQSDREVAGLQGATGSGVKPVDANLPGAEPFPVLFLM